MEADRLTLDDALLFIRTAKEGPQFSVLGAIIATGTLMDFCEDSKVTFNDMLRCLDFGGLPAEFGARALYVRSGRDGLGWSTPDDLSLLVFDRPNWEKYLRENNLWPT